MDFGLKQRQHRDVRMQRRDVSESEAANVATLRLNVVTFQRVVKTNVVTFQRRAKMTSRRWDPTSRHSREGLIQCRDVEIPRRDVPKKGKTDDATLQRRDI